MTDVATAPRRSYLRPDARRRQLLDAAARRFAADGYAGLTMVSVAAEAAVSRRLVYDHFPDLATLYEAFFEDRVLGYLDTIPASFPEAYRQLVTMPAEDQRVLRLLVADPGRPELEPLQARFRSHVEQRWLPAGTGPTTKALLWAVVGGLLTLADLVARGEVAADTAVTLAERLVTTLEG